MIIQLDNTTMNALYVYSVYYHCFMNILILTLTEQNFDKCSSFTTVAVIKIP